MTTTATTHTALVSTFATINNSNSKATGKTTRLSKRIFGRHRHRHRRRHITRSSFGVLVLLQLLTLLLVLQVQYVSAFHMILEIPAGEEECYLTRIPFHSNLHGSYNIMTPTTNNKDKQLNVEQVAIIVTDEVGKVLFRSPYGKDHGSFEINMVETKRFQICVQNAMKIKRRSSKFDDMSRHVGLSVHVDPPSVEHFDNRTQELVSYSSKVYSAVSDLTGHYEFRKFRETKHRHIVETIFTDLLFWCLAQISFVVLLAIVQVWYLKRTVNKTIV